MMRSMFAGVSGLKAHQVRMDVIGNNIANVNSAGYKSSRATFQDMLSQTLRSASAPTAARGGSNPQQIGLGVQVGSVDVKHTQGNTQSTGYITDLAIEGEGFFILGQGDNRLYTRAGMFGLDNGTEGNLVSLLNGERVLGYVANSDGVIDHSSPLKPLYISASETISPRATTSVTFAGNLDNRESPGYAVRRSVPVYDSRGREQTIILDLNRQGDMSWEWDANWLLISDGISSHNNKIENGGDYIVFAGAESAYELRTTDGKTVVATSDDGRVWTSLLVSDETGGVFEFERDLAVGAEVRAMADQDRLFLTSEVSLTKEPTGFVPSMTLEKNFTDSLLAAEGTYTVTSDPIHGFVLVDSLGTAVARSSDGITWNPVVATVMNSFSPSQNLVLGAEVQITGSADNLTVKVVPRAQGYDFTGSSLGEGSYRVTLNAGEYKLEDINDNVVRATSTDRKTWKTSGGLEFEFDYALPVGTEVTVSGTDPADFALEVESIELGTGINAADSLLAEGTFSVVENPNGGFFLVKGGTVAATSADGVYWTPVAATTGSFAFDSQLIEGATVTVSGDDPTQLTLTTSHMRTYDSIIAAADRKIQFNPDGSYSGVEANEVRFKPELAYELEIAFDFSQFTMYADTFTGKFMAQNGYTNGALESYAIDQNGVIIGSFSNGLTRALGQVALARFANPAGLQRAGSTMFVDTVNSGEAQIEAAGVPGYGQIAPSSLEMSNVDLSEEFTEMIITQRGFQANSRIITTSDEMLQELVNLKR